MVPEMFAEQPDPKRRAEQELAYKTLKHCVVELRIATNTIEKMAKMAQQQHEREMLPWDKKMHLEGSLRALAIICMPRVVEPQKRNFVRISLEIRSSCVGNIFQKRNDNRKAGFVQHVL